MTNRGRLTLLEHMRQYPPIRLVSNHELRRELSPACAQEIADALECWLLIEQLRAGEGAMIEDRKSVV